MLGPLSQHCYATHRHYNCPVCSYSQIQIMMNVVARSVRRSFAWKTLMRKLKQHGVVGVASFMTRRCSRSLLYTHSSSNSASHPPYHWQQKQLKKHFVRQLLTTIIIKQKQQQIGKSIFSFLICLHLL